ncbi:MAG TPA: endonuclease/exonuclease/phosphatase family protein [Ktedonobacteraceae bacterium]|nr:endonuclease/exonuclease/phosphatase family protein [Ktedonobacteraceae bacterium]
MALLEANSRANAELLAQQVGMRLIFGEANTEFHIAWLSRLPVLQAENYRLPMLAKTLLQIEVAGKGGPVALFATHLNAGRRPEDEQVRSREARAILDVLHTLGEQPHALVGDFNSLHPTDEANLPLYLTTAAEEGEDNLSAEPLPRQVIPLVLEAGYTDCYRALHPAEPGYTYAAPNPSLRLDYIFASPSLAGRLLACDRVTDAEAMIASDHLPLWAEFT